jgi:hypothetical protein
LETKYRDFLDAPSNSTVEIKDSERRVFTVEQLQAGLMKKWIYPKWGFGVALGWEFQVWTRQMRLNWFNSFSTPPNGSDLSLYGPFLNLFLDF